MKPVLFAVAILGSALAAPHALHARSKAEIRAESTRVVESHGREAALIYNWLKHTPEIGVHRMRGATQNTVYIFPPGHREAVYDKDGKLVRDGMNEGSYNYYPYDQPLNHFTYDTLPWLVWGASKKDPTSRNERIVAYVEDLGRGFGAARKANNPAVDLSKLQPHETAVLAMFIGAIEDGGATKVYDYLADPERAFGAAEGAGLARQLETGLARRLKDYEELMTVAPRLPKTPPG
jgi:hypothetical protein